MFKSAKEFIFTNLIDRENRIGEGLSYKIYNYENESGNKYPLRSEKWTMDDARNLMAFLRSTSNLYAIEYPFIDMGQPIAIMLKDKNQTKREFWGNTYEVSFNSFTSGKSLIKTQKQFLQDHNNNVIRAFSDYIDIVDSIPQEQIDKIVKKASDAATKGYFLDLRADNIHLDIRQDQNERVKYELHLVDSYEEAREDRIQNNRPASDLLNSFISPFYITNSFPKKDREVEKVALLSSLESSPEILKKIQSISNRIVESCKAHDLHTAIHQKENFGNKLNRTADAYYMVGLNVLEKQEEFFSVPAPEITRTPPKIITQIEPFNTAKRSPEELGEWLDNVSNFIHK